MRMSRDGREPGDNLNGGQHGDQEEGRRQALLMAERDPKTGRFPKGNGEGWGAAKGKGKPAFTADNQPPSEAKAAGHEIAREIREEIARRRKEIIDAQFARALDLGHAQGHAAAKDLLDRVMPPVAKQEHSGPDGEALPSGIQVTFVRPGEA